MNIIEVTPFEDMKVKKSDLYQSELEMVNIMNYRNKRPLYTFTNRYKVKTVHLS